MNEVKSLYHIDNQYILSPIDFGDFLLVQLGRRYCITGEVIAPHLHREWFEITIVLNGEAEVINNGASMMLKKGDIHFSFPYEIHEIRAGNADNFEYDFFSFIVKDDTPLKHLENIMQNLSDNEKRVFHDERIEFLIRNAIFEYSTDNFGKEEIVRDALHQTIIYIIRGLEGINNEKHTKSNKDLLCYKIMNYIDTHLYTLKSIGELSDIFKYDASYLSAIFKSTTGKTLFDYYSTRRLEHAKMLILERNMRIWEIAELLHYSSAFSFSKAFTKKYGISPKKMQTESYRLNDQKPVLAEPNP